ncbi:MAG: EpsG family protein [Marinobacter sp.]|uniref:EpsG family protein n=1 Tax=Marinobacter sp. TaxID=50741 RepID=UPI003F9BAE99
MVLIVGVSLIVLMGALVPRKEQAPFLFFSFFFLLFLSAFRALTVGTDTVHYEHYFLEIASGTEWLRHAIEPGWVFINELVIQLGGDFRDVLVLATLLTVAPVFYVASRYSKNPMFTIFLYCTLYFYWYSFNITRQSIAVGFVLVGVMFFVHGRSLAFSLFVLLASMFHYSALFSLIFLFAKKVPNKRFHLVLLVFVSMLLGLIGVDLIISLIGQTGYKNYIYSYGSGNVSGNLYYLLILNSFFVFVVFFVKSVSVEVKLFFVFVLVQNLLVRIPFGDRLVLYFSMIQVVFFPYFLGNIRSKDAYLKIVVSFVVVVYAFVILYQKLGAGQILPYKNVLLI